MGSLIIFIAGICGACQVNRRTFLQSWCCLINFSFAVYAAVFLTPLLVSLLEIKGLEQSYKICGSLIVLVIVFCIALTKLVGQLFPDTVIKVKIPVVTEKLGTMLSSFFFFMIVASFFLFCFTTIPYSQKLPLPESIRSASSATLRGVIRTINSFSFQRLSPSGIGALQFVGLIEAENEKTAEEETPAVSSEEKKSDGKETPASPEKNSTEAGALTKTAKDSTAAELSAKHFTGKLPGIKSEASSSDSKEAEKQPQKDSETKK